MITILVLVFVVIAGVAFFFIKSNKDVATTKTTTSDGLGNILSNVSGGLLGQILNATKQNQPATPAPTV